MGVPNFGDQVHEDGDAAASLTVMEPAAARVALAPSTVPELLPAIMPVQLTMSAASPILPCFSRLVGEAGTGQRGRKGVTPPSSPTTSYVDDPPVCFIFAVGGQPEDTPPAAEEPEHGARVGDGDGSDSPDDGSVTGPYVISFNGGKPTSTPPTSDDESEEDPTPQSSAPEPPPYWPAGVKSDGDWVEGRVHPTWSTERDVYVLCGGCSGYWWVADHPYAIKRKQEMWGLQGLTKYGICEHCKGHWNGVQGANAQFFGEAIHPTWCEHMVYLGGIVTETYDEARRGWGREINNYPLFNFTWPTEPDWFPPGPWRPPPARLTVLRRAEFDWVPELSTRPWENPPQRKRRRSEAWWEASSSSSVYHRFDDKRPPRDNIERLG